MKFEIKKDTPKEPQNRHWQFCVGSCHAPLALRSDYIRQLKFIHDELGIRYVRFHGIFNDDMDVVTNFSQILPFPGGERFRDISFRKIGLAYDNVLAAGMKPFVELSFMPKLLASGDAQCLFFYKGNITPPRDENEWSDFIRKFIEYLIHRYGKEEVESWYFEVWNEPDLYVFWSGTRAEYFRLYEITARAIKSVDEKIRVGGPSTSGSRWVKPFMQYCEEHKVPVDFITTHQYAGDPLGLIDEDSVGEDEGDGMGDLAELLQGTDFFAGLPDDASLLDAHRRVMPDKSETEDILYGVLCENSRTVKKQAKGLPVIYTEWNENSIFTSPTNDTRKVAAYVVRAILETEDSIDASSIWTFSDIYEEFHNYPQEFHGGFGMVSNNGIPKPIFYALKMLASTSDMRYQLPDATIGEIGMAAFGDEKKIQVLLFRQKMKNLDLAAEKAEVEIDLETAPESVVIERVDAEHGNPLAIWNEMGSPLDLTQDEVESICEQSRVVEEKYPYSYKDGKLQFSVELKVNDVCCVKIRK